MSYSKTLQAINEAETVDTFLKFCYCFPYDLKERMDKQYGQSLSNHFYEKFEYFTSKSENNFIGLIKMFNDMSKGNQASFIKLINEYNQENK